MFRLNNIGIKCPCGSKYHYWIQHDKDANNTLGIFTECNCKRELAINWWKTLRGSLFIKASIFKMPKSLKIEQLNNDVRFTDVLVEHICGKNFPENISLFSMKKFKKNKLIFENYCHCGSPIWLGVLINKKAEPYRNTTIALIANNLQGEVFKDEIINFPEIFANEEQRKNGGNERK